MKHKPLDPMTFEEDSSAQAENLSDKPLDAVSLDGSDCQLQRLGKKVRIGVAFSGYLSLKRVGHPALEPDDEVVGQLGKQRQHLLGDEPAFASPA